MQRGPVEVAVVAGLEREVLAALAVAEVADRAMAFLAEEAFAGDSLAALADPPIVVVRRVALGTASYREASAEERIPEEASDNRAAFVAASAVEVAVRLVGELSSLLFWGRFSGLFSSGEEEV